MNRINIVCHSFNKLGYPQVSPVFDAVFESGWSSMSMQWGRLRVKTVYSLSTSQSWIKPSWVGWSLTHLGLCFALVNPLWKLATPVARKLSRFWPVSRHDLMLLPHRTRQLTSVSEYYHCHRLSCFLAKMQRSKILTTTYTYFCDLPFKNCRAINENLPTNSHTPQSIGLSDPVIGLCGSNEWVCDDSSTGSGGGCWIGSGTVECWEECQIGDNLPVSPWPSHVHHPGSEV